jgi:hypothetical protein
MADKTGFRDSALRAVAIIGLIAILVLGAWGIIQLVVGLPDFFSSFGSPSSIGTTTAEQMNATAPSIATAGQPFTLSWSHQGGAGNYGYAISYACADGLMIAAPVPTGQMQLVPCNTPFNFTNASASITLIPVLPNNASQKQVTTTFTVGANRLSDGTITSTGTSSVVTILPSRNTQSTGASAGSTSSNSSTGTTNTTGSNTTGSTSTGSYTPSGRTSNLYGLADLAVRILSVTPTAGNRVSVQFEVSNAGTNVAAYGWGFRAQLPIDGGYTYVSQSQQKLYPGDRIVYTLGFTAPSMTQSPYGSCGYTGGGYYIGNGSQGNYSCTGYAGSNVFTIAVDPQGLISDQNRANNTATTQI